MTNPLAPSEIGSFGMLGDVRDVKALGSYAYVAEGPGLSVIDVSDASRPDVMSSLITPGAGGGAAGAGDPDVADGSAGGLRIVDVADPASPVEVGAIDTPGYSRNVAVSESYAYVADGSKGLRVIDISDPADPREIATYDTPGSARSVAVFGDLIYVADALGGLFVLRHASMTYSVHLPLVLSDG